MSHSASKQRHQEARKRQRQEKLQNARQLAKQPRSTAPVWFLTIGLAVMVVFVLGALIAR